MRVTASDLRRIVQFLDTARSSDPADPFPPSTLSALTGLIAADQADYFEVRPDRTALAFTMAFEEEHPAWLDEASARLAHQNPLSPFRWAPADGPLRMSEIISERELRRLDYYNDFLRPAHIRDRLRVWLWRSAETAACVTLTRSDARFSDRDKAMLAVLQPHLAALRERSIARGRSPGRGRADDSGGPGRCPRGDRPEQCGDCAPPVHVSRHCREAPRARLSQASCHGQVGGRRFAPHGLFELRVKPA